MLAGASPVFFLFFVFCFCFCFCLQQLLTALTTALVSFYNLRGLDLSPTTAVSAHHHHIAMTTGVTASDGQKNALEEQRLCVSWRGACPSLRRVVFPSRTVWWLSEAGTWISGSSSDTPVPPPPRCHLGACATPPARCQHRGRVDVVNL
jgi:hypothetical protein